MNATEEVMLDRLRESPQYVNVVFSCHAGKMMEEITAALAKLAELQLAADKMIFSNWAKECPDGKPPIPFEQWREEKNAKLRAERDAIKLEDL
jgi:hypothetical protein